MKIASNGRVRRSEAEWQELFSRFEKSELSAREFCGKEGIGHESFRRWREKLNAQAERSAFVPVTSEPSSPPSWTLEITLPDGFSLRLQG